MPESATTLSLTATLATPTMTPMATPTPTPTLQPTDAYVVFLSVLVSVTILLCVCIVCGIVCCCCYCDKLKSIRSSDVRYRRRMPPMPAMQERRPIPFWDFPEVRRAHFYQYPSLGRMREPSTRADEGNLNRLCLIGFGIKQLTIHQRGGTYPLGSGDATLKVFKDTVEMETVVRYAVILHGPFVYSAGYKPASVVVYLNLEGANLQKPLKLMLNHWCKPVKSNSKATLKLLQAPHTAGEMENFRYIFHEVQGISLHNTATFTISEPQCLYCVVMRKGSQASYNAIAFQKNLPEDNLVKFRIQFMCDCLEWNAYLMMILEQQGWKINSHGDRGVPKFSFHDRQITATPHELHGPGWQAAIDGQQSVRESDFLEILGKEKNPLIAEVQNGRYPPCIYYQVLYTSVADRRQTPAFWTAKLQGTDVKLFFSCKVLQELVPPDEVSLTTAEHVATAGLGSHGRRTAQHCRPAPQAVQPPPQAQVMKTDLGSSVAGRTDYLMLFRIHVSRKAARKAKAVLEGLGLDQNTIDACISAHPSSDEEIVQEGLTKWCGGKGTQPPTWSVLIAAMDYADIAQQDIGELKQKLGH